jgi:hypothetical protein
MDKRRRGSAREVGYGGWQHADVWGSAEALGHIHESSFSTDSWTSTTLALYP